MKNRLFLSAHSFSIFFLAIFLSSVLLHAQTFSVSGSGTAAVNGVYVKGGTYQDIDGDNSINDYYTKISGTSSPMVIYYYQYFWTILPSISDQITWEYYWYSSPSNPNPPTMPLGPFWSYNGGGIGVDPTPTSSQNTTANMTFANGSSFTPPAGTPGTNNNPIGRFQLTGSSVGGVLQTLTISLTGTRSGVTAVKLWSSTDSTFNSGSDTQLSSKTDNISITFNGFNSLVNNSAGTYYFITVDLSSGAAGNVTATIPSQASLTFAGANQPSSFTSVVLTSGAIGLPVELISFVASEHNNSVALNWSTATEINNYGFEIERRKVSESMSSGVVEPTMWNKIGFVAGNGTSSTAHSYLYTDASVSSGTYVYRLKQINNDGTYIYSGEAEVMMNTPTVFSLNQNYPNPFNPSTTIAFALPEQSQVTLKIYDLLGKEVAILVNNESMSAGNHAKQWDASALSGGVYFYRLQTGTLTKTKRLVLLK